MKTTLQMSLFQPLNPHPSFLPSESVVCTHPTFVPQLPFQIPLPYPERERERPSVSQREKEMQKQGQSNILLRV